MPNLLHQRLTKPIQPKLRRVIRGHLRMWISSRERRDIKYVSPASLPHQRNRFVTAIENPEYIRFEHCAKVFRTHRLNRRENPDAGIVDENVGATERCKHRLHLIVMTHIADVPRDRARSNCIQFRDRVLEVRFYARSDGHVRTGAYKRFRNRTPDPTRSARNDRTL